MSLKHMRARIAMRAGLASLAIAPHAWAQDSTLINRTRQVLVSSLDAAQPKLSLDRWLPRVSGVPSDSIRWEVNDCGEGGDARPAPTCVEAAFRTRDGEARVSVVVTDLRRRSTRPAIWLLTVTTGTSVETFRTLAEWALRVRPAGGQSHNSVQLSASRHFVARRRSVVGRRRPSKESIALLEIAVV
jgi:hypothetical protein